MVYLHGAADQFLIDDFKRHAARASQTTFGPRKGRAASPQPWAEVYRAVMTTPIWYGSTGLNRWAYRDAAI
jgi:hypothetical protein